MEFSPHGFVFASCSAVLPDEGRDWCWVLLSLTDLKHSGSVSSWRALLLASFFASRIAFLKDLFAAAMSVALPAFFFAISSCLILCRSLFQNAFVPILALGVCSQMILVSSLWTCFGSQLSSSRSMMPVVIAFQFPLSYLRALGWHSFYMMLVFMLMALWLVEATSYALTVVLVFLSAMTRSLVVVAPTVCLWVPIFGFLT